MCFLVDQLEAPKVMRVDQLKNTAKNIRFKNVFLSCFLQDRLYPHVEFYEKKTEKHLSNRYKSPKGFFVGGLLYCIIYS